ncbi:hypothetical protein LEP1GSC056_3053 [Leptospira borgpetersenii str. Brem 328]|uniref:Uncharacterized protein n=1 Tax=Leptospira borgpetersenii str. Brem 328 TaxID=1049780 RepID=A0ABC9SNH3_LEPBO|nr:hypothetical protein LEP1GSC056_3053 [Leptospira borgpetersenii str. Brem 328]
MIQASNGISTMNLEPVSKLLVLRKHKNINVKWTNIIQRSPMHFGKK